MTLLLEELPEIEPIHDGRRAALLVQHPLRPRILNLAREPISATVIAGVLGESRQKVNYHMRQLRSAGFLRLAGRRRRRGLTEQRYVATARAYVLAPGVAGIASPNLTEHADATSATRLVALASRMQAEVATVVHAAALRQRRVPTFSISADVRFESAEQRGAFATAIQGAIARVVAEHTTPMSPASGSPPPGRAFRLLVACHPVPLEAPLPASADVSEPSGEGD
jgi:biotin operon repressor